MADTYSQITIHLIFAVKNRRALIKDNFKEHLYKYISGIIRNKDNKLLAINGIPDHIHILIGLNPKNSVSSPVRDIKSNSTLFVNEKIKTKDFAWQEGFGAFSYSKSQRKDVINYIQNQKEHHKKKSFKEEYINILQQSGIDYKSEYIFKALE